MVYNSPGSKKFAPPCAYNAIGRAEHERIFMKGNQLDYKKFCHNNSKIVCIEKFKKLSLKQLIGVVNMYNIPIAEHWFSAVIPTSYNNKLIKIIIEYLKKK